MDQLYQKGFIANPANNTKSVVLTDEGRLKAEALFKALFTCEPQPQAAAACTFQVPGQRLLHRLYGASATQAGKSQS
jgi:hypothetical protein